MSDFEKLHPRAAGGLFAAKVNSAPADELSPSVAPATPVIGYLRLGQWGPRDQLIELSTSPVDIRAFLDTCPLSQVKTLGDLGATEPIVELMRKRGALTHDGPADLDIHTVDLDDYIAERAAAGQESAVTSLPVFSVADSEEQLRAIDAELEELRSRRATAEKNLIASLVAGITPNPVDVGFIGDTVSVRDASGALTNATREQASSILAATRRAGIRGGLHRLNGA